jgi:hypothetical protein
VELHLVQDVAVIGVAVEAGDVFVGIYGGPDNVCASVTFSFDDPADRAENVARLRRWERAGTPLSLLVRGDTVRLFSERSLFGRALEATTAADQL